MGIDSIKLLIARMKKIAVIKTSGKQYLVEPGDTLKIEKLSWQKNNTVVFDKVLLTATDKTVKIGTPLVKGSKVEADIVGRGLDKKITGVKMKPKKRYHRYYGHRQPYTQVKITSIKTK